MPTLDFNPKDNIIVIEAKIWGKVVTTTRLVFDTGASMVMLPRRLLVSASIPINPKNVQSTTTASAVESVPLVTVPKISVLGETVVNVPALVKDLPPESRVDGLLGLSFIRHFKVNLDFAKGKLTLSRN